MSASFFSIQYIQNHFSHYLCERYSLIPSKKNVAYRENLNILQCIKQILRIDISQCKILCKET
jgi:hypothetical protein